MSVTLFRNMSKRVIDLGSVLDQAGGGTANASFRTPGLPGNGEKTGGGGGSEKTRTPLPKPRRLPLQNFERGLLARVEAREPTIRALADALCQHLERVPTPIRQEI